MSSYPKALTYYISRLNNYSRQKVRLSTIANTSFVANDQIVLELPQGLIDLSTFTLQGRLSTANGTANQGVYQPFVEGLIDNIMVEIGGIAVQSGFTNYNDLFNIMRQYQLGDRISFRRVLQHELVQPNPTIANYTCANQPFAIWNWLGFLGSVKVLDTTILPPVKLYIRLAPNSVLTNHGVANASITYQLSSVNATVDILDISDGIYYNMVAQRLAQSPLEIPFTNYQTVIGTSGAATQTTRWSTSTDCLTDVIATVKPTNFNNNSANNTTLLSNYFTRNASGLSTSTFSVNGIRYPTIPCDNTLGEVFTQTAHTLGVSQDTVGQSDPNMTSHTAWAAHYWVHANSFTYPDEGDSHRLVGLSGRGNQILGSFESTGTGEVLPIVWLKSQSVLRIGSSKMCELIL
jgi:hypothetical protein